MREHDPIKYKQMVKSYQEKDEPTAWFENIYKEAQGDYKAVFWADLEPSPYLIDWLEKHPNKLKKENKKAIVVGCGVGDDCEALSEYGYEVLGFDISQSAIDLCKSRYPNSKVTYIAADLFDYPKEWFQNFDVVYECNTIQVLPGNYRIQARDAIASFVAPQGFALVSCRSRQKGQQEDDIPLPLDENEINGFELCGLIKDSFLAYDDNQEPCVPHFFATFKREKR